MPNLTITDPIEFLGGYVVRFSANLGYNSTASTINVTLVDIPGQAPIVTGGPSVGADNNPGTYVLFSIPDAPSFSFGGIIQRIQREKSSNGEFVNVTIADPRVLFKRIPININIFNTANLFSNQNVIDHIGRFSGNVINAGVNPDGVEWSLLKDSIELFVGGFHGFTNQVVIDPSFDNNIPNNYLVKLDNSSLEDVLTTVARENALDFYVTSSGPPSVISTIRGISRSTQTILDLGFDDIITANGWTDRVRNYDFGRELRLDANNVVIWGDNVRTFYTNVNNPVTSFNPIALFDRFNDGNYTDRPFVGLENIDSADSSLISALPRFPFEKKLLSITTQDTNKPQYAKERVLVSRPGYYVNEAILRAALHSKESWAACVWYSYKDSVKRQEILDYPAIDRFDAFDSLGDHVIDAINPDQTIKTLGEVLSAPDLAAMQFVPENLGIFSPNFWRHIAGACAPNIFNQPPTYTPNEFTEALQEACFQATVRVAEEFYGRKFIVALPDSDIMDELIENSHVYEYLRRNNPIEYEVTDGGWHDEDESGAIPALLKRSESDEFRTDDGRLRPMVRIDNSVIRFLNFFIGNQCPPTYAYEFGGGPSPPIANPSDLTTEVDYSNLESDKAVKISKTNINSLETPVSNYWLYNSDVSVEQFLYDPRFAIITLGNPILVGNHVIRDYDPNFPTIGKAATAENGWKDFADWMYATFTLVTPNDPDIASAVGAGAKILDTLVHPLGPTNTGNLIASDHYNKLLNKSREHCEETFGFAERRYTTSYCFTTVFDWYVPLRWTFQKYGPFKRDESGQIIFLADVGGAQVINDSSLAPWKYGSVAVMTDVGDALATASEAANTIINTATFAVEGFPEFDLGDAQGINSNISNISLDFGVGGVVTTYKYRTFAGPTPLQRKENFDNVADLSGRFSSFRKETISLDEIVKNRSKGNKNKDKKTIFNSTDNQTAQKKAANKAHQSRLVARSDAADGSIQLKSVSSQSDGFRKDISSYTNLHVADFGTLFQPYTTDVSFSPENVPPTIPAFHNTTDVKKLNPFFSSSGYWDVAVGDSIPTDYVNEFDGEKVRSIGWRLPAVGVGWGYDIFGRPAPSGSESNKFINNVASGGMIPPSGYLAGPIDIKWHPTKKLWVAGSDSSFFAKITDSCFAATLNPPETPCNPLFRYGWVQVDFDDTGRWHTVSGGLNTLCTSTSGAWNISEIYSDLDQVTTSRLPQFSIGVPSGTIVKMQSYAPQIAATDPACYAGEENINIRYIFEWNTEFFFARIKNNELVNPANEHQFRWKYTFDIVYWDSGADRFVTFEELESTIPDYFGMENFVSDLDQNYAINIVEWNNPNCGSTCCGSGICDEEHSDNGCIVNPGVNVCGPDYPEGFRPQPISSGTIVNMRILPRAQYSTGNELWHRFCFEAYNAHDGPCAAPSE